LTDSHDTNLLVDRDGRIHVGHLHGGDVPQGCLNVIADSNCHRPIGFETGPFLSVGEAEIGWNVRHGQAPLAVDLDEDLVQVPLVTRPGLAAAQRIDLLLPQLHAPTADGLVGDDHAALKHQLLDLTEAEREPEVQPHAVGDHLDRVP
jgi:hypothetical protein